MMEQPPTDRYLGNTVATGLGQLVRLAVVFWLTPILIHGLGLTRYGIWVLLFALVEYSELFTFGIGTSFARFIAAAEGEDRAARISRVVSAGVVIYAGVSLAVVLLWLAGFPWWRALLERIVGQTGFEGPFLWLLVAFLLRNLGTPYRALINGLQRMGWTNLVMVLFQLTMAGGSWYVIRRHGGIPELAVVWMAASALNLVLLVVVGHLLYPALRVRPRSVDRATLRTLWSYGIKIYAASAAETGNRTADKIILQIFLGAAGPVSVTLYDVGQKVAGLLLMVPAVVVPPIVPATAAGAGSEAVSRTMDQGYRLIGLLAVPITVILCLHAPDVVRVWTALHDYARGGQVALLLLVATFAFVLANPAAAAARGLGNPILEMQASIVKLAVNVILSVLLVRWFGLFGVLVATLFASVAVYGFLLVALTRRFRLLPVPAMLRLLAEPLAVSLLAGGAGRLLFRNAGAGWGPLLLALVVEGGVVAAVLFTTGYLDPILGRKRASRA
jgi:O-antigen/teichoic acid export membrane protein